MFAVRISWNNALKLFTVTGLYNSFSKKKKNRAIIIIIVLREIKHFPPIHCYYIFLVIEKKKVMKSDVT